MLKKLLFLAASIGILCAPLGVSAQVFNLNQIASSSQAVPYFGVLMGDGINNHKATASSSPTLAAFTATSTTATSTVQHLFTNILSATTLCLTGDICRTTWPTGGGGTGGSVGTSTADTSGQVTVFGSTNATPALIGGFSAFTFNSGASRLSVTYASTTGVTAVTFFGALTGNADTATKLATARTLAITGDLSYTSPSFDGSGNVTAAGTIAANAVTYAKFQQVSANKLVGNVTSATANAGEISTSTLFGIPTPGQILSFLNGQNTYVATTTFSSPLLYAAGNVTCQTATGSLPGCLSAADFTTFNGKQAAGNYITALTGDVTASGPGSVAATIAANAVTYAKFQQVGANKILGNVTSATANVGEISTSTWFGTPTPGTILAFLSGQNSYVSTTTLNIGGSAGSVANAVTFNNGGSGASSGQTFNGSGAVTISYNTLGAVPTTRNVNTTYPLSGGGALSGDLTLVNNFGTTTTTGLPVDSFIYTGHTGIFQGVGSSSLRLPTSALASANVSQFTNDAGYDTFAYPFIASATTSAITFGGITITGKSDGCATFASGVLNSTGVACGSGGGASFGQSWEVDTAGQLAPTTTLAVSIPTWLSINDRTLAYASTTNGVTLFGLNAGGNAATTSATTYSLTAIGFNAAAKMTTSGLNNTAVGASALAAAIASSNNTAVGVSALAAQANGSGSSNVAVGSSALLLMNGASGKQTVAIGASALAAIVNAGQATAVGYSSLSNATGGSNTALGYQAGLGINSGTNNVAIGMNALAGTAAAVNSNIVIGQGSAGGTFAESNDIIIGVNSAFGMTTGTDNILIGNYTAGALTALSTGTGSIGLGNNIFFPSQTSLNQLNIGNLIYGTLPATTTAFQLPTSGSIGIGTSTPYAKFAIQSNNGDTAQTLFAIGSSTAGATTTLFSISNTGSIITQLGSGLIKSTGAGTALVNAVSGSDYVNGSGVSGNCVKWGASNSLVDFGSGCGGSGSPGGASNTVQYNNGGTFAGIGDMFFNAANGFTSVGGSTTPQLALFSVAASSTGAVNTTIFAVASSSSGTATTTLFSVTPPSGASDILDVQTLAGTNVLSVSSIGSTTLGLFGACSGTNALTTDSSGNIICGAISGTGGASFPFTPLTNYAVNTSATTTPIWAKLGLFASSTSQFDQINIGSSTVSTMATSTDFGNFVVSGNASTTALTVSLTAKVNNLIDVALTGSGFRCVDSTSVGQLGNTTTDCGQVNSLTVNTAQGVSGSFSAGATPALSLTLGALTGVTSFNGLVVTANTGVITTGTWQGTAVALANGGTGAALSGANQIHFINSANTATAVDSHFQYIANNGLMIGTAANSGALFGTSTLLQMSTSTNNFAQTVMTNTSSAADASSDFVVNNDKGTNTTYFGDFGINSSGYANPAYTGEAAGDVFLSSSDSGLDLSSATSSAAGYIKFLTGGTLAANERMRITNTGQLLFGTTTPNPYSSVVLASTTTSVIDFDVTGAALNAKHFLAGWNGSLFTLGTSTDALNSTSSLLTFNPVVPASVSIGSTTQTISAVNGLFTQGTNGTNGSSTISAGKWQVDMYNTAGTRSCMFVVGTALTVVAGACTP